MLLKMFFLELSRTSVVCIEHFFSEFLTSDAFSPHYVQTREEQLHCVIFLRNFVYTEITLDTLSWKKNVLIFYACIGSNSECVYGDAGKTIHFPILLFLQFAVCVLQPAINSVRSAVCSPQSAVCSLQMSETEMIQTERHRIEKYNLNFPEFA